jgi:hypothetical protein
LGVSAFRSKALAKLPISVTAVFAVSAFSRRFSKSPRRKAEKRVLAFCARPLIRESGGKVRTTPKCPHEKARDAGTRLVRRTKARRPSNIDEETHATEQRTNLKRLRRPRARLG